MKIALQFAGFLVLAIGFRVYSKSSFHDDYKSTNLSKCNEEQRCVELVESEEWDECFDTAYSMGRRSSFDEGRFYGCLANSQRP